MTDPVNSPAPEDMVLVPSSPTEEQWGGLARQIMLWLDMEPKTPRALFKHLERSGYEVPDWLRNEAEMQSLDHVPSKGTRCTLIYRAMIAAASPPSALEEDQSDLPTFADVRGILPLSPPTEEAVERRVARAICRRRGDHWFGANALSDSNKPYLLDARAAIAALATPAPSTEALREAWQPITSAPKDGTLFDAWCTCDTLPGGGFRIPEVIWEPRYDAFFSNEAGVLADDLTHWRPLPDPPFAATTEASSAALADQVRP